MTRYADTLLADGERVVLRTRQHWLATVIDGRYPWLLLIAAIVLAILGTQVGPGVGRDILGWIVLAGVVIALLWLARVYWNWWAEDYMVTNRRVIKVEGIVNKHTADSSLEKINDAVLDQNLFGRLFNYGDLDILTATEQAVDRYRMLDAAPTFKRAMLNQKAALEQEYARPMMPSPPIRAIHEPAADPTPPPSPALAAAGASMAPAGARGANPAPARPPMTPDEVTRTLASLADLRDRGAISEAEYEQKKGDLLDRL
jgi:hypothetical protein